jgi:hypothetical protein
MTSNINVDNIQHIEHPTDPFIYNQHTTQQHTSGSILEDQLSTLTIKVDNIGTEIINIGELLADIRRQHSDIAVMQNKIIDMNNILIQKLNEFDCQYEP